MFTINAEVRKEQGKGASRRRYTPRNGVVAFYRQARAAAAEQS